MSYSISTLLTRNLQEVFGENDAARRRTAIDEIFTDDCVFYDLEGGIYRGRDEIDRIAGAIRATHPDFRYQPIAEPEEVGNGGRLQWVSGRPGDATADAGTDFIIARDGRIIALYLFFDKLRCSVLLSRGPYHQTSACGSSRHTSRQKAKLAGVVPSRSGQLRCDRGCGAATKSGRGRAAPRVLRSLRRGELAELSPSRSGWFQVFSLDHRQPRVLDELANAV